MSLINEVTEVTAPGKRVYNFTFRSAHQDRIALISKIPFFHTKLTKFVPRVRIYKWKLHIVSSFGGIWYKFLKLHLKGLMLPDDAKVKEEPHEEWREWHERWKHC